MRRFVVTLGALVAATAVLVGPSAPSGAVATRPPVLQGFHAGPPDAPGRYVVGLSTVRMVDPARADRTLTVDIWYPADKRSDAPTASLDLVFARLPLPGVLAGPEAARGSFPLVVFSHGNGGVRFQSWFLMQALAAMASWSRRPITPGTPPSTPSPARPTRSPSLRPTARVTSRS